MLKIFFLIVIIAVITSNLLHAQSYFFRKYQVENGLSNNSTICCLQDKKGFLWFGTKDGLNRFDGYSFRIFRNDPDDSLSIGNNFIYSIYEDLNEILWIGTEKGLYKYDATTERFSLLKGSENGRIRDIRMDGSGNLWFINGFTLVKYNGLNKTLRYFDISNHFEATSICTSSNGTLWVSTSTGLLKKYNSANNSFTEYSVFNHSVPSTSKWIEKIYCTSDNSILVGTSNQGAKLFNINTGSYEDILTYDEHKTEIFARNFVETSPNEIWIATESGVYIYNLKTGVKTNLAKKLNDPYSISDNAVYAFCKDYEGGTWVCTYFGGINYYPKEYTIFTKYFPKAGKNSLSGNVVREIHKDQYENLWIGTEDAGLNKLNLSTGVFTHFIPTRTKGSISYTNIHALLPVKNELWIGTFEHGLDVMDIKKGIVTRHYGMEPGKNSLKSNFIYCIKQKSNGEIILGTTRGAYTYNYNSNNFSLLPGMPLNNWYTSLLEDHEGIMWAGTYGNGVHFYNTRTKKSGNFTYAAANKTSLSSDRVNSIFEDCNRNLWFATEDGLCKFNRQQNNFTRYTTKNGLPSNFILSILEDSQHNLWISTSKGLASFNPNTNQCAVYTVANGIINDQFNFNSAYKDESGRMYFGSVKGLISFKPEEFIPNNFAPPVYLTNFQVFNKDVAVAKEGSPLKKSITYTDKIILTHDQSTINIGFAALTYTAPEMTEYAYRMEGLDKRWTSLKKNRNAHFTNLLPGTYIFKVKASNSSGKWNAGETQLLIEILPPWYKSTLAYCIYTLLILLVTYYSFRYYHNKIKKENKKKYDLLEKSKEEEVFRAKLEFFTNIAHEIKTPLTLIKAPLEKVIKKADNSPDIKNLRIMERNTNRLIELTNQLLDFRKTEIEGFRVNFVKANITELLEEAYASFKVLAEHKSLIFEINLPPAPLYASVDVDAFNKILSNLLSNAIKYCYRQVQITLNSCNVNDRFFTVEIKNDGFIIPSEMKAKIFEPFFRLKETAKQKGTGIGLALTRSLVQLHKGSIELKEPQNNFNVFSLTMPLQQENESTETTITNNFINGNNY